MKFRIAAVLAASALAVGAMPTASAELGPPSLAFTGPVRYSSPYQGYLTVTYACDAAVSGFANIFADVTQRLDGPDVAPSATGLGGVSISCVGEPITVNVPLLPQDGKNRDFGTGEGEVSVSIGYEASSGGPARTVEGLAHFVVAEVPIKLTADASPEKVVKGKKITVKGTSRRDGRNAGVPVKVALEFKADGKTYKSVKTVTSEWSASGPVLSTSATATKSGTYRFRFAGDSTTKSGVSAGDHIVIKAR